MTNRNRLYLWLVVLILAGTLGGVGLMIYRTPTARITRKNFDRIQKGMTTEEVWEILADPAVPVSRNPIEVLFTDRRLPPWESERIFILVTFTAGRVEKKEMRVSERTWKDRLARWLPW
jgi:hypothetical protein